MEEIRLKNSINLQLAINGFLRQQPIKTSTDFSKPIKVVNKTTNGYASLTEARKFPFSKEDITLPLSQIKQRESYRNIMPPSLIYNDISP
jgi:hypothetical protein